MAELVTFAARNLFWTLDDSHVMLHQPSIHADNMYAIHCDKRIQKIKINVKLNRITQ